MDWLNIIGAIGGSAGIVALIKAGIDIFNARSNRTSVDIKNMQEMLNEAHEMYNSMVEKYDALEKRVNNDRDKTRAYIDILRGEITKSEARIDKQEERINSMEKVINLAWRCKFPANVQDCPVIREYEKRHLCEGCATCNEK